MECWELECCCLCAATAISSALPLMDCSCIAPTDKKAASFQRPSFQGNLGLFSTAFCTQSSKTDLSSRSTNALFCLLFNSLSLLCYMLVANPEVQCKIQAVPWTAWHLEKIKNTKHILCSPCNPSMWTCSCKYTDAEPILSYLLCVLIPAKPLSLLICDLKPGQVSEGRDSSSWKRFLIE